MKESIVYFIRLFRPIYALFTTWLRSNTSNSITLSFVFKVLRRWPNADFRRYVSQYRIPGPQMAQQTKPYEIANIPVCRLGPKNRGKVIMLLENQSHHAGFCALWIYFLNRLSFSDRMGFCHCINWNQSDFYQEKKPVYGTTSIFEYYFQQPSGISVADAKSSDSVIYDYNCPEYDYDSVFHVGPPFDYQFTDKDIEDFAKIQKRYIRLQPRLERSFKKQITNLLGRQRVLGVHARGADSKVGYKGHPVPTSPNDYLTTVRIEAEKMNADKVFLATDDVDILQMFQDEFGDKLIFYNDVIRSKGTVMNCYTKEERPRHHYKLGLEIVRDVYTLATCDGLVCGMSYVSLIAQIVRKAEGKEYKVFNRLFHGLVNEGVDLTSQAARNKVERQWIKELEEQENNSSQTSETK